MNPVQRLIKDNNDTDKLVSSCVTEFMNASIAFHKLHLKISGPGSFAAHKALNKLYEELQEHADTLAEGYQGATQKLLSYTANSPRDLNSVNDGISYTKEIATMITDLQKNLTYSEIINDLDSVKSTLNSARYKLTFLK